MLHDDFFSFLNRNIFNNQAISSISRINGIFLNEYYKIETSNSAFFIKRNSSQIDNLFTIEAENLRILSLNTSICVPKVIKVGNNNEFQFMILEWINKGFKTKQFWIDFAEGIAQLHNQSNTHFGFDYDNFIGNLPQKNTFTSSWIDFFIEFRIRPLLEVLSNKGLIDKWLMNKFEVLFYVLPQILPEEKPALIHGDLWHGNWLIGENGKPCLFDPALCYASSEMDIAFSEMFGNMDDLFYETYFEIRPSLNGYEERADIYNLYYLLIHVQLFGTMYLPSIQNVLSRYTR